MTAPAKRDPRAGEIGKPLRRFTFWPAEIPVPVRREAPVEIEEPAREAEPATHEEQEAPA